MTPDTDRPLADSPGSPGNAFRQAAVFRSPEAHLSDEQARWLQPRNRLSRAATWAMYWTNRMLVRSLFRVRVEGREHLPEKGPAALCPNHSSSFDPPLLAASFPYGMLARCRWYGRRRRVMGNRLQNQLCYWARVVPIVPDASALAAAAYAVERAEFLIWFPEGRRSTTGELGPFKPGIGAILRHCRIPVHLISIEGASEAWPARQRLPAKFSAIRVRIAPACHYEDLVEEAEHSEEEWDEAVATALRARMLAWRAGEHCGNQP